jgi:signal transduction histidine kinase
MAKLTTSVQLILANEALARQNEEMEKRAAELVIVNQELAFQNKEKGQRAAELLIANKELLFQNAERGKRAEELIKAYQKLRKAEEHMKGHIAGLEQMMFITSHKVRKPVANILGLTNLLEEFIRSPAKLRKMVSYLKLSEQQLDDFTMELTEFISQMERTGKG